MRFIGYEERFYRNRMSAEGLITYPVVIEETDMLVSTSGDFESYVTERVREYRSQLKAIKAPSFFTSLTPIAGNAFDPPMIRGMIEASKRCGVGPMASVAGAIAEYVGYELLRFSREVVIENGGDIFLKTERKRTVGIFAGASPFSNRISLTITPEMTPLGICTSSGTVGHSLSFGKADAAVVLSKDTLLADAAATAVANLVVSEQDISKALEQAKMIPGVIGTIIIVGKHIGIWGHVFLSRN